MGTTIRGPRAGSRAGPSAGPSAGGRRGAAPGLVALCLAVGTVTVGCLDDDFTGPRPTSTLAPVAPSTTLVPVEFGEPAADSRTVDRHAAPMLDGELHVLRSDDPATPFVDGEPAEIRRITQLAVDRECDQLHDALDFWLRFVPDEMVAPDQTVADGTTADEAAAGARRASVFARAAYDAIAFVRCGAEDP